MARDVLITPASGLIDFLDTSVSKATLTLGTNGILVLTGGSNPIVIETSTSGSSALRVDGTNGTLFEVVDDLSGSLMSVNDAAGLPVLEVFADSHIVAGRYGQNDFYLDTNGNLGLGTSGPASLLHLQSSASTTLLRIDNTNAANDATILLTDNNNPTGEGLKITYDSSVGDTYFNNIYASSTRAFTFAKGDFGSGTSLVTIYNDGNVGIGTTSPNKLLEVANSSGGATINISTDQQPGSIASPKYTNLDFSGYSNNVMARIQSWDESSNTGYGYLTFHTNTGTALTEKLRITRDGNVGIGTTSPERLFHVLGGTADNSSTTIRIGGATNHTSTIELAESVYSGTMSYGFTLTTDGGTAGGATNNFLIRNHNNSSVGSIAFSIKRADGNVGIGLSDAGAYQLNVEHPAGGSMRVGQSGGIGLEIGHTAYSANNSYTGIKNTDWTGTSDYALIVGTNDTYLSAKSGGTLHLRGGGNQGIGGIYIYSDGSVAVNEGQGDADFRVEGDTDANLLFVDASTDRVGIGTASPSYKLQVNGPIYTTNYYAVNTASSYQKLSVYGDGSTYGIGMVSGISYGALGDWAMTFRFNSDDDRGFWWGDTSHNGTQGAMSLTTHGYLTVANRIKVGGGESDTSGPSYALHVVGDACITGNILGTANSAHMVTGSAFATTGSPSSVLEYQQACGQTDTKLAPTTDWYNTIRMGHGNPYSYYSNTIAVQMTGSGAGQIRTQLISNNVAQGWRTVWDNINDGAGSGLDADLLDGLQLHTGRNNEANKVVRTDGSGYLQAGWINTTSGSTTSAIDRIYASYDGYIRYVTPAHLSSQLGFCSYCNSRLYPESGTTSNYLSLRSTNELEFYNSSGTIIDLYLQYSGGVNSLKGPSGGTIWHSANDGPGSSLNADLLDGYHGSYYSDYNCLSNKPTIPTNNNQLTNGAGYTTCTGTTTASNAQTFTNKCGNISQWTNDVGYVTSSGGSMSYWYWGYSGSCYTMYNGYSALLAAGSNISLSRSGNTVTISASGGSCGTVTSVATGGGLTGGTITTSGTISHADTSSVSNLSTGPSGNRRYIKSMNFDTYGHVTGYTCNYIGFYQYNTNCLRMDYGDSTVNDIAICAGSGISITSNSGIQINNLCASDYRLKSNLECYDTGYDIVKSVNTYKYQLKHQNETSCETGMIAHELQCGGMFHGITGEKDQVNAKNEPVYQCVSYSALVPTLWSALRKSIDKIERLENKVAELENRVNILGQCVTE